MTLRAAILRCLPALLLAAGVVQARLVDSPDPNTLWLDGFDPIELADDSDRGWFNFDPDEISAEQVGERVRFREVSDAAGGSIDHVRERSA